MEIKFRASIAKLEKASGKIPKAQLEVYGSREQSATEVLARLMSLPPGDVIITVEPAQASLETEDDAEPEVHEGQQALETEPDNEPVKIPEPEQEPEQEPELVPFSEPVDEDEEPELPQEIIDAVMAGDAELLEPEETEPEPVPDEPAPKAKKESAKEWAQRCVDEGGGRPESMKEKPKLEVGNLFAAEANVLAGKVRRGETANRTREGLRFIGARKGETSVILEIQSANGQELDFAKARLDARMFFAEFDAEPEVEDKKGTQSIIFEGTVVLD